MRKSHGIQKALNEALSSEPGTKEESSNITFLQNIFLKHLPQTLPKEMKLELFAWAWSEAREKGRKQFPESLIDLFMHEYDAVSDILNLGDWSSLADFVDSYAEELDIELMTYIMGYVVEKGGLSES